jgi:hypothetical protein
MLALAAGGSGDCDRPCGSSRPPTGNSDPYIGRLRGIDKNSVAARQIGGGGASSGVSDLLSSKSRRHR